MELSSKHYDSFSLYTIDAGRFKLDGGAMFGVVPKTLWSKQIPADEKNRIHMALRCLLIQSHSTGRKYLIDTGIGNKFDEKMSRIYGVDTSEFNLDDSLDYHGFSRDDITDIIFTHLHFDHCGGTTDWNGEQSEIIFPNADLWVTKTHWETATKPNTREKASFLKENIEPLAQSDKLQLIDEGHEFEPGLTHRIVNGHTLGQQLPYLTVGTTHLMFAGDLVPTFAHIPVPWVMGYDMRPIYTLEEKAQILPECESTPIYLFMEHDAHEEVITVRKEGKNFTMDKGLTLGDLP